MVGFFSGLRPFCDFSTLQTHLFLSKTLLLRGVLHRMYPFCGLYNAREPILNSCCSHVLLIQSGWGNLMEKCMGLIRSVCLHIMTEEKPTMNKTNKDKMLLVLMFKKYPIFNFYTNDIQ